MTTTTSGLSVGALGALAAVVLAGALVPLRDDLDSAAFALVLVVVVVGAASLGGRLAGALTSLAAALAFNFFFTQPYGTLRVHAGDDVVTIVLLFVVGVMVGELSLLRERAVVRMRAQSEGLRDVHRAAELAAGGSSAADVWAEVQPALVHLLHLAVCRFEPADDEGYPLPRLDHRGRIEGTVHTHTPAGFEIPPSGVELAMDYRGRHLGRLVLVPQPGHGASLEQRKAAVAVADQLAAALANSNDLQPLT
ncbi:MAG: DUF4118 domain-containing protein [Acidimicrobiales bacterium]|nr:DUF4118 domain-containing protein [Acidimicrobiales bacterium]